MVVGIRQWMKASLLTVRQCGAQHWTEVVGEEEEKRSQKLPSERRRAFVRSSIEWKWVAVGWHEMEARREGFEEWQERRELGERQWR